MITIDILLPKNFMNVGVTVTNHLTADTNDSALWDEIMFPLPKGKWKIHSYSENNKLVTLIDKRNFIQRLLKL